MLWARTTSLRRFYPLWPGHFFELTLYNYRMNNKWVSLIATLILALVVINIGEGLGGTVGDLATVFGGVAFVYGIVEFFRKQKSMTDGGNKSIGGTR
jgi:hypothetical protein